MRFHRPVVREGAALEVLAEGHDPMARIDAAHEAASVLLHTGRASGDPEITARLVAIVDDVGLDTLAELWASRPARSLPGALWRLYVLREWMRSQPEQAAREYALGVPVTEPNHAVAGVEPPGPDEIATVADEILRGVFTGDFAVALERAAAFCRVVVAGRAFDTDETASMLDAARLRDLADEFTDCARLWRSGKLV